MYLGQHETGLRALMVAGLNGDASAHEALLKALSPQLRAYFRRQLVRIGRTRVDAEDLVQETLIAIHVRRHTYHRSQPLTPWIYAIARHRLIDYWRKTKASLEEVPFDATPEMPSEGDAEAAESGLDLEKLMSFLTPKARLAIRSVKIEGLTATEEAARSGASLSAVKVSIHRSLRALSRLVREG